MKVSTFSRVSTGAQADRLSGPISCCSAVIQQLDAGPGRGEASAGAGRSSATHPPGPPGSAGDRATWRHDMAG